MNRWDRAAAIVLAIGVLAPWTPAKAQISASSNAPVDMSADEAEVVNSKCVTTWRGAAEALQGDSRIRADTITAYLKPKGGPGPNGQTSCGGTDRIEADGDVYYVTPTQIARGDHAVYEADAGQIVMTGNVIVVQGKDVARGERLTIDVATRVAHLDAPVKGGRVRAVFYPDQPGTPGAPPPAPAH
jgi:lipopolysaccharide export system protein LptA